MAKGIFPRFMQYVSVAGEDECWEWNGYRRGGYGSFKMFGSLMCAHRVSYELFVRPAGDHMMVCHKCDNPICVNPNHLFLGSAQENMDDKISKGRHQGAKKGSRHHFAKLSEWQVKEIKLQIGEVSQYFLADKYGVSQTIISNIKTGKRWGHVL